LVASAPVVPPAATIPAVTKQEQTVSPAPVPGTQIDTNAVKAENEKLDAANRDLIEQVKTLTQKNAEQMAKLSRIQVLAQTLEARVNSTLSDLGPPTS
jgi:cell division protein FtsB